MKVRVSIIVPVYNESATVVNLLESVITNLPNNSEIVVVNDGSTDKTSERLKSFNKNKKFKIFSLDRNYGKGYAVRFGLRKARGEVFIIQDADLEYNPNYYPKLLAPIDTKRVKVVYGSRLVDHPLTSKELRKIKLPHHFIANKFLSFLTNTLYGSSLTDMETGYKIFTREVYKDLSLAANRFEFEVEITAKILKAGYKIIEVPIETNPRSYKEGKKISWKDGLVAFFYLIKYRFSN